MKFAMIASPKHLHFVRALGFAYHFALGQDLVRSNEEMIFYRTMHDKGHFIMIDNGAAEPEVERVPFEEIVQVAEEIRADEVIMPDVLRDSGATLSLLSQHIHRVPPCRRMLVPQGDSWDEWKYCLADMLSRFECRTIGVPKHLERLPGGRARALDWLLKQGFASRYTIHLLGIWINPARELRSAMLAYQRIRGFDTAAPLAYAQNNATLLGTKHYSYNPTGVVDPVLLSQNVSQLLRILLKPDFVIREDANDKS
jgi:hypothetical protein